MIHYAKAVAHFGARQCRRGQEKALFTAAKTRVPESRRVHNNYVVNLLDVAEAMLNGELEYRKGNHDAAFAHLRRSVELSDGVADYEPWGWMMTPAMRWGHFSSSKEGSRKPRPVHRFRSLGLDGNSSRACQSIPTISGRCTGCTNAWSVAINSRDGSDQTKARPGAGAGGDSDQGILLLPSNGHGGSVGRFARRLDLALTRNSPLTAAFDLNGHAGAVLLVSQERANV